jgi:hypothetical protein
MGWVENVTYTGEMRNSGNLAFRKPERKGSLRRWLYCSGE